MNNGIPSGQGFPPYEDPIRILEVRFFSVGTDTPCCDCPYFHIPPDHGEFSFDGTHNRSGNTVISTKCFNNSALRKGDLVVVTINYDQCSFTTIRRFIEYRDVGKSAWLIADRSGFRALPDGSAVSKKYFDSHKVGSVPLADIKLKVLFVLPTHIKSKNDRALQMH